MEYQVELDASRISHLIFRRERRTSDINWFDYRPEKRILFGLIRVRKERMEGFWETVYDYENIYDCYRTAENLENSGYKIYPDLEEKLIVKEMCNVSVVLVNGEKFTQTFYEESEAIEWMEAIKVTTGKKHIKIEVN